ncbi:hypothetical protein [Pseudomonas izuensis]|uniref:hypothetical protein n=1 Tax=Pseudomonas izuensis TaxID=2684212 RepID=UPI00135A6A98|nr:hypothetical protein [Pseudomonas izuensis]
MNEPKALCGRHKVNSPPRFFGITYSNQASSGHDFNEMLTVERDDQILYITQMLNMSGSSSSKLSQEGAAEALWAMLSGPLQS